MDRLMVRLPYNISAFPIKWTRNDAKKKLINDRLYKILDFYFSFCQNNENNEHFHYSTREF